MSVEEFDNGYWYAVEIKAFAREIGIDATAKLRKDELEDLIKYYLRTGDIGSPVRKKLSKTGVTDIEKGLSLNLPVVNYTSNRVTKDFIAGEALKIDPTLKKKSGARYRLNRWREEQVEKGVKINYGDLVREYIRLNRTEGSFPQARTGRYINFLSDFRANETASTREGALSAWKELKTLNIPKDYQAWKHHRQTEIKSTF